MKKNQTFLILMLATFLFIGNDLAMAQTLDSSWTATPSWNTGSTYRGFTYANNRIYVAGRTGASVGNVQVMNGMTGAYVKALDNTGILNLTFDLVDAESSADGSILAAPLTTDASAETGWGKGYYTIYRWADESSAPEVFVTYTGAGRVDMFSVVGDVTDDAVIMGAVSGTRTVWRYIISAGVVGTVEEITLDAGVTTGTVSIAVPVGLTAADGFWYNNASIHPTLFDKDGNIIGTIPAALFEGNTGQIKLFSYDSKDYLLVADAGKAKLINITGKVPGDLVAGDVVYTSHGVAQATNLQDVDYRIGLDGSLSVFSFSADNGIYAASTEAAPTASDLMFDGIPVVGETLFAEYTYGDMNGDLEGASEIKWYISDDAIGTGKVPLTADAGDTSYTVISGDIGKYISFTVLPVAATGTVSDPAHLVESELFGAVLAVVNAPVASDAALTGIAKVGEKLTASYTYTDADGDLEGVSMYEWYRISDTDTVKVASGSLEYTAVSADAEMHIMFVVIPVAATGFLLEGTPDSVVTATTVLFPPLPPVAKDLAISGREEVAAVLKGTYTFEDLNGDLEAETGSILKWYRATDVDTVMVAADTNMYELVKADSGRVIFFEVTPVSVPTEGIDTGDAVFVKTDTIKAEPEPVAPVASDVMIHGLPEVGVVLHATYTYSDRTDDPEGESIYKWFVADDSSGTNKSEIAESAGLLTALVTEAMVGKHVLFEVTPVATIGGILEGLPVQVGSSDPTDESPNDGDFERIWMRAKKHLAVPEYMGAGSTERGFAVGADHIYIASRNGGTNLLVVDKVDGTLVSKMNTEGMDVGLFKIQDAEVSSDGQILACPLVIDALADGFVIYKWENELAAPTKFIQYTPTEVMRLGDKFTVVGDVSASAVIYAVASGGKKLVRWVVTGGVPDAGTEITLENVTSTGVTPAVAPFDETAGSSFIVDGRGFQAQVFDKDGKYLYAVENVGALGNQSNSPNIFQYKGRTLAAFHEKNDAGQWDISVKDITGIPQLHVGTSEVLSTANQELGGVHVQVDNDAFHLYMMSANEGIARFSGTLELPVYVSAENNVDGDKVFVTFSKAMPDSIGNASGWTVKAAGTEIAVDTVYGTGTDATVLTLELAAAVTEGQVVTVEYDGTGSVTSVDGMPLAAFGPEDVINIVGAAAPVASGVAITGDAQPSATLTGAYTYSDANGDLEGVSTFQWWEATASDGSGKLKLLGEKALTYAVGSDMGGKYVAFEVTPVAATGGAEYLVGDPVMSAFVLIETVGVSPSFADGVRMYPNPVSSILTINNCAEVQFISLLDVTGRVLMRVENDGANEVRLTMAEFSNGIYFVKLTGENNQIRIEKVLKTK